MNDDLSENLRRLRRSSPQEAGPECERALAEALRESRPRRARQHPGRSAWQYWLAVAACLGVSFGALFLRREAHPPPPRVPDPMLAGFVPLPYGQGDTPLEQAVIVRVNFPANTGSLQADLLIGQDGMARAVRWVK